MRSSHFASLFAVLFALNGCSVAPPKSPEPPDAASAVARSLSIIRDATPEHPRVLKILFYGQSISVPKWTDQAVAKLRAKYPNVVFDYRNMALGGWAAPLLERATGRDVSEFYPDLIVFHVYGDHRAYERIIQTFRSRTAADVIVQTDHVVEPVEPLCPTGFHLRWSPPPGCTGHFYFKQHQWSDFMSGIWIPTMARKYDLAMEPRRQLWNDYLGAQKLDPAALIQDAPHPNERGWALMADLFTSWFEGLVDQAASLKPASTDQVRSFAPLQSGSSATYAFSGNRIELLATGPLDGKVKVSVDGKAPEDLDGCWQTSRVSRLANVADWPAIKQVWVDPALHRANHWTIRISALNDAQDAFSFALSDDKGPEGKGQAGEPFTSTDGHVKIEPDDWNLAYARSTAGKGIADGSRLTFERSFVCADQTAVALPDGGVEQRHVLATGLENGPHVVEVSIGPDAPAITEVRAYRPPLVN